MAFFEVENNGNWEAGGTYYFIVNAWYLTGYYVLPIQYDFCVIQSGFLSKTLPSAYNYDYTDSIGQGFLFAESYELPDPTGAIFFESALPTPIAGPVITNVEVIPKTMTDPYSGEVIEWGSEYLFGVKLKVTVSIPANCPTGTYKLLAANFKFGWRLKFYSIVEESYLIGIGEIVYQPGGMGGINGGEGSGEESQDIIKANYQINLKPEVLPPTGGAGIIAGGSAVSGVGGFIVRLIPFIYNAEIAYVVALTNKRMKFLYDDDFITEITTPYLAKDIFQIQYKQLGDVMWLVHPLYAPRKLSRTSPTTFKLQVIEFTKGPFLTRNDLIDPDWTKTAYMASSVTAVGATGTLTCSDGEGVAVPIFQAGHIGALFRLTHQKATTTINQAAAGYSSALDVKGDFSFIAHGTWTGTVELQRNENGAGWDTRATYTSKKDYVPQENFVEEADNVQYRIYVHAGLTGDISCDLMLYDTLWDGIVRITGITSTSVAVIQVIKKLESTAVTRRWAEGAWSDLRGWPATVTFFNDRAVYGGQIEIPEQVRYTTAGLITTEPPFPDRRWNKKAKHHW